MTKSSLQPKMKSIGMIFIYVLVSVFVQGDAFRPISIGPAAKAACAFYEKVCGEGMVCAMQYNTTRSLPICVPATIMYPMMPNICNLQKIEGSCKARFIRFYFDANEQKCRWFTYGGCDGNENNFKTLSECEQRCIQQNPEESYSGSTPIVVHTERSTVNVSPPIFSDLTHQKAKDARSLTLVRRPHRSNRVDSEKRRKRRLKRREKRRLMRRERRLRRLMKKRRREGKTGRRKRNKKKKKNKRKKKRGGKRKNDTLSNKIDDSVTDTSSNEISYRSNKNERGETPVESGKTLVVLADADSTDVTTANKQK